MGNVALPCSRAESEEPEAEYEPEGEYEPPEPETSTCVPECRGERGCYHMPMLEEPVCSCPPNK